MVNRTCSFYKNCASPFLMTPNIFQQCKNKNCIIFIMFEKNSFFSSENALFKNICVSLSLSNWMIYTFLVGWVSINPSNVIKAKIILSEKGLMRMLATLSKEILSLGTLTIFIKGLFIQMEFVIKAVKSLNSLAILLAVIYFFYYRKK